MKLDEAGVSRGFCFVEFDSEDSADLASQTKPQIVDDKEVLFLRPEAGCFMPLADRLHPCSPSWTRKGQGKRKVWSSFCTISQFIFQGVRKGFRQRVNVRLRRFRISWCSWTYEEWHFWQRRTPLSLWRWLQIIIAAPQPFSAPVYAAPYAGGFGGSFGKGGKGGFGRGAGFPGLVCSLALTLIDSEMCACKLLHFSSFNDPLTSQNDILILHLEKCPCLISSFIFRSYFPRYLCSFLLSIFKNVSLQNSILRCCFPWVYCATSTATVSC